MTHEVKPQIIQEPKTKWFLDRQVIPRVNIINHQPTDNTFAYLLESTFIPDLNSYTSRSAKSFPRLVRSFTPPPKMSENSDYTSNGSASGSINHAKRSLPTGSEIDPPSKKTKLSLETNNVFLEDGNLLHARQPSKEASKDVLTPITDHRYRIPSQQLGAANQENLRTTNTILRQWHEYTTLFMPAGDTPMTLDGYLSIYDEMMQYHPWSDVRSDQHGLYIKWDSPDPLYLREAMALDFKRRWDGKYIVDVDQQLNFIHFPSVYAREISRVLLDCAARLIVLERSKQKKTTNQNYSSLKAEDMNTLSCDQIAARETFRANNTWLRVSKRMNVLYVSFKDLPKNIGFKAILDSEIKTLHPHNSVQMNGEGYYLVFTDDRERVKAVGDVNFWLGKWQGKKMEGLGRFVLRMRFFPAVYE